MPVWKLPPKAKIYEALSAVADGRVHIRDECRADVISSAGNKSYLIEWNPELSQITSNDNASYYQGYLGYPIIAVLMKLGKLRYDSALASHMASIPWKAVNTRYRNNYDKAIDAVFADLTLRGVDRKLIDDEVDAIMDQLKSIPLERLPKRIPPPTDR